MVDDVVGYFLQYLGLGGYFYMDWEPYVKFESKGYVAEDFVRFGYGWGSKVCDGVVLLREGFSLEFFVLNGYKENTMLCRHVDHFVFNRHSGVSLGGIKLDFMQGRTYDEDVSLYEMVRGYDFGASIYNVLSECGDYLWNGV